MLHSTVYTKKVPTKISDHWTRRYRDDQTFVNQEHVNQLEQLCNKMKSFHFVCCSCTPNCLFLRIFARSFSDSLPIHAPTSPFEIEQHIPRSTNEQIIDYCHHCLRCNFQDCEWNRAFFERYLETEQAHQRVACGTGQFRYTQHCGDPKHKVMHSSKRIGTAVRPIWDVQTHWFAMGQVSIHQWAIRSRPIGSSPGWKSIFPKSF